MSEHHPAPEFSSGRSTSIRDELVRTVYATARDAINRTHRRSTAIALIVAGVLSGGAISATAVALALNPGIPAPPGVEPGQPFVTELGEFATFEVSGARDIPLGDAPAGANHVRVSVECLTAGRIRWGLDAEGNNLVSTCDATDVGVKTEYDFALSGGDTLYVDVSDGAASRVSLRYLDSVETAWGVNDSGDTYGTHRDGLGAPDLIAAIGVDPNGEQVTGYVRSDALFDSSPEHTGMPSSPEQAIEWQEERERLYPNGWDLPLYASDGVTQIGTFHIGG